MDDKGFDHIIKDKLESLTPPYKEEAWKALDYRLDLLAPLPWYSRWKSLLVASSLGIITLLNIGLLYKVDNEQQQLEQLVTLINERQQGNSDTIYVSTANYLGTSYLTKRDRDGLDIYSNYGDSRLLDPSTIYRITDAVKQSVAQTREMPNPTIQEPVSNTGELVSLPTASRQVASIETIEPFTKEYELNAPDAESMYVRGVVLPPTKRKWEHPLDPSIGLSMGYLIPNPDIGERFVTSRQSILIESPIRGNFRFMTGLSYQEYTYKLDDVDDNNFDRVTLLKYPDFGSFASSPDEITVDNTMVQIPLYFRYYKPLNRNWSVFAGGGPTIDILVKQKFNYSFLDIRNEQLIKFNEIRESDEVEVSLGSISGNIGIEHYFSPRLSGQVELNYQYGLGKIGLENRSFNSFAVSGGIFYKLNNPRAR